MTTIRKRGRLHSRFALTSMELYQAWSTVEFNANVDANKITLGRNIWG